MGVKITAFEINIFNTLFSALRFEGKNQSFLLENASNLTFEFLYDSFNKKNLQNFLSKLLRYKSVKITSITKSFNCKNFKLKFVAQCYYLLVYV